MKTRIISACILILLLMGLLYLGGIFVFAALLIIDALCLYEYTNLADNDKYEKDYILDCLKLFYKRFFNNQFKRSCLPDGPKIGSITLSPRADWRMPSDACSNLWLNELYNIDISINNETVN